MTAHIVKLFFTSCWLVFVVTEVLLSVVSTVCRVCRLEWQHDSLQIKFCIVSVIVCISVVNPAFSALMLLVGRQEVHAACKNWVVRYWHGYLSGARCRWFAYGLADATATPSSLAPVTSRNGFNFLVPAYPGCPGKRPLNGYSVVVV